MSECIFCDIVREKLGALFLYRDDTVSAFMDIQPVNPGHLLVIPNDHASYLADLPREVGGHMFEVAQMLAKALRASDLRCEGVNFFLADGQAAMQEIFHVHLHVFPRFEGDGFGLKFADRYFQKPPYSELESAALTLRKAIEPGGNQGEVLFSHQTGDEG